jgi:TonB family protein
MGAGGEYRPSKLSGILALCLGLACLGACVNWAEGRVAGAEAHGPDVSVDTGGATLVHPAPIEYAARLKEKGVAGTVLVNATVDGEGNVVEARALNGPEGLKQAAVRSVRRWRFAPDEGEKRLVKIEFHAPAEKAEAARAREEGERRLENRDEPNSAQRELEAARVRLRRLEELPESERDPEAVRRAHAQIAERERDVREGRTGFQFAWREPARRIEGRRVLRIEVRGMGDEAVDALLARLPVRVGDELSERGMEAVRKAALAFDERLEVGYGWEPEGALLRIHPRGEANSLIIRHEGDEERSMREGRR